MKKLDYFLLLFVLTGFSAIGFSSDVQKSPSVTTRKNSTGSDFTRRRLNIIEGTNTTVTMSDDSTNNEIDMTIDSSGSGSGGYAIEPATVAVQALKGLKVSSTVVIGATNNTVVSTTTVTSTMSVILANPTAGTAIITLTLPDAATNTGLDIMVYKVDTSTIGVVIKGAGSDLIEGTGTIRLDAKYQHASLHSLGSAGWGSGLGGIQYTPHSIGAMDGRDANSVGTSSNVLVCPVTIEVPVIVTGFRFFQTAGAANVAFGVYDTVGNLLVSTGPVSDGGAGVHSITMTTPVFLAPGQYYSAFQASNIGANYGGTTPNGGNGSILCSQKASATMGLPNPYGFPGTASARESTHKILVNGGRTVE